MPFFKIAIELHELGVYIKNSCGLWPHVSAFQDTAMFRNNSWPDNALQTRNNHHSLILIPSNLGLLVLLFLCLAEYTCRPTCMSVGPTHYMHAVFGSLRLLWRIISTVNIILLRILFSESGAKCASAKHAWESKLTEKYQRRKNTSQYRSTCKHGSVTCNTLAARDSYFDLFVQKLNIYNFSLDEN